MVALSFLNELLCTSNSSKPLFPSAILIAPQSSWLMTINLLILWSLIDAARLSVNVLCHCLNLPCVTPTADPAIVKALYLSINFLDFRNYVGQKSWEYLDNQGYDMSEYTTMFSELWVQEFSKKGGGHHSAHIHWNQHVSGFYFLKCSDKTSYPIFHEPRTGARATKLKLKPNIKGIWGGTELIHFKPTPGTLIIFPGYLEHEYAVDFGIEPFRFIHWNIQAVPKEMAKDVV